LRVFEQRIRKKTFVSVSQLVLCPVSELWKLFIY